MKKQQSKSVRLFGAPEPEKFTNTFVGKALSESAAIHFENKKDKNINKLLALEKLALDIFQDSQAARAFVVNPEEYMRRSGFTNVSLDLNSQEIKVAMAIGDPLAREAARKGDIKGFIDAILAQGVKPAVGLGFFAAIEALIYVSAVAISWVAAAYTVETVVGVHHKVGVAGVAIFDAQYHKDLLGKIASYIGDEEFSKQVASQSMEKIMDDYISLMTNRAGTEEIIRKIE